MAGELPPLSTTAPIVADTTVDQGQTQEKPKRVAIEVDPEAELFPVSGRRGGEIDRSKVGRRALPQRLIDVFGEGISAIARPIEKPVFLERSVANILGGLFANKGLLADGPDFIDYRKAADVKQAIDGDLVAPRGVLGPITLFRPGLGNTAPGPAQIARLAQYTDKVIIAYANPGEGDEAKLRPIDEIDGVKLPPSLEGKIFAIGSPKNLMITFEQASDLFLEQLDSMKKQGLDLSESKATVVAHSQGGLDALLTRRRLNDAGLGNTFGRLITLATPFKGSPVSDESMAGLLAEAGDILFDKQATRAVRALDPTHVKRVIKKGDEDLVDISLIGYRDAPEEGHIRRFFKFSESAIEAVKFIPSIFRGRDARDNDGMVTVDSQDFGRLTHRLTKAYDHAGIAEDPAVIDQAVRLLA